MGRMGTDRKMFLITQSEEKNFLTTAPASQVLDKQDERDGQDNFEIRVATNKIWIPGQARNDKSPVKPG